jgi:hypothetical protein
MLAFCFTVWQWAKFVRRPQLPPSCDWTSLGMGVPLSIELHEAHTPTAPNALSCQSYAYDFFYRVTLPLHQVTSRLQWRSPAATPVTQANLKLLQVRFSASVHVVCPFDGREGCCKASKPCLLLAWPASMSITRLEGVYNCRES